jgi:hypothetical protein
MASDQKETPATHLYWTLDPVVSELQLCPAASAKEFTELIIPGRLSFLSSDTGAVIHSFSRAYGASKVNHLTAPTLSDTGARRLHPHSLRRILEKNWSWLDEAQFYPPLILLLSLPFSDGASRETAARELVEHLDDQYYAAYQTTLTFRSPVIDLYLSQFLGSNESSSVVSRSSTDITSIMPCGALRPLEASTLTSSTTIHLITGVRVYIVYPPSLHNLTTLQRYLVGLTKDLAPNHTSVCDDLEDGITFVQRAGQTVTIPPFSPTVVVATATSTGVTILSRFLEDLPCRLRHLKLMLAQIAAIQHVCHETTEVPSEYHTAQLYKDLSTVLRELEPSTSSFTFLSALGAAWNEEYSCFRDLVEAYIAKPFKEHIHRNIPRVWDLAVHNLGFKHCPVCGVNFKGCGTVFLVHFRTQHWDRNEDIHPEKNSLMSITGGVML